jgi:NAD(P)-dependent dehydrogenase (short-subunit alcohol dehydrogenase family)
MDLQLEGKIALVTGSSGGIGAGIAATLAREGATVVVHGREDAERVAAEIGAPGGRAAVAIGDLATDEGAAVVAQAALAAVGRVDILVNNAGAYENRSWMGATADRWAELYASNVLSAVRMVQLVVPRMREAR